MFRFISRQVDSVVAGIHFRREEPMHAARLYRGRCTLHPRQSVESGFSRIGPDDARHQWELASPELNTLLQPNPAQAGSRAWLAARGPASPNHPAINALYSG